MATSPDPSIRRSLLRLVAVSVALTAASFAGCTVDQDSFENPGAGAGGENSQSANSPGDTPLPKTDLDCTVPEPGCLCDTEGQHLTCGKVVSKNSHGQASCGQGVSVCTNGVWGECVLTGLDPIPLEEAPPGFYHTQKAQTPTPCQNNPCNPYCWNYPDGPNDAGIADSGTNLDPQDGGLGTTWDAGPLPCTPLTQSQACAGGKNCGEVANGCGGVVSCGNDICAKANQGEICGGNGVPNQCGKPPIPNCTPQTTAQACSGGKNCGWVPNGCGGVISCGNCGANQTCGLGGLNICGPNCTPKTCTQLGKNCGLWGDGCGNTVSCGTCPTGQICGAYSPNVCWAPGNCTKKTVQQACQNAGKDCGAVPDGCGGTLECGACPANKLCGGGGTPNVCGGNVCVPKTYQQACSNVGKNCGPISDGCGGTIDCGTCAINQVCGGVNNATPNKCDEVKCVKNACATGSGVYCGPFPHGCEPEPPNFLLTLDRSGSMTGKVGTKTKWQIAVDAVNKLTTNYQNKMRFGLSLFPDHDTSTPCNQTKTISVPVAPGKETTIQNLLNASLVSSNVNYPKGKMTNLYNAVVQDNGHQPPLNDPTRKNFVVLLTDGAQNCGDKTTADNNTVTLLQNMYNQGIGTFVIGFGSGIDATALNKFANAGGYPKPGGGNKFYDAQDEASLNTALEMIAEQATSLQCDCTEPGETCGGGGIPHKCGKPCVPNTCPSGSGSFCGDMPDGCGGTLKCGCTLPETCGGSGIIDKCGQATCKPISCADQGIACGQAGDGCGNEINCGTCPAPQTCGGGGVPGQCGAVKFYTDGYFVRDYIASCPSGTAPYWQLWSWTALTPDDSSLDFQIQTADDEAGLASATSVPLRFSVPPGPSGLQNQVVTVKSNPSPDTQVGAASVDNTLQLAGLMRNKKYLRVTTHLKPTADKLKTAMLKMWNMQVDCIPSE